MPSNKILPIAVALVLFMVIFVGLKSCDSEHGQSSYTALSDVPQPGKPDIDSPADTIRSLTAEVDLVKKQNKELKVKSEALLNQRNEIEATVSAKLRKEMREKPPESKADKVIDEMSKQLSYFNDRINDIQTTQEEQVEKDQILNNGQDIPIGFGLDGQSIDGNAIPLEQVVWIEPLGADLNQNGINASHSKNGSDSLLYPDGSEIQNTAFNSQALPTIAKTQEPVYTVPRNSTLIGSISMTALIGRIPLNGIVQEPFPFKVIVGKENLAANGITMPFLNGMIFSGTATGDWTLSCVRGTVHSVTYVFNDGTIRTLSSDDGSLQEKSSNQGQSQRGGEQSLGWISDRRGIPCVTGERISNAIDYLSGRVIASAASAAAMAFAQGEVTNTVSPIGGVSTSVITGDSVKYAGYNALSGGVDEVAKYLEERGAQSFDVIYVDTGVELAVHIDAELPIDYELNGRKTNYENQSANSNLYLD